MKTCYTCLKAKSISEFYANKKSADGFDGLCKECAKAAMIRRYYEKRQDPAWVLKERRRGRLKSANQRKRGLRQRRNNEADRDRTRRYRIIYKDRFLAHCVVRNAIRLGTIVKGPCEQCGNPKRVHGHHDDYTKPLEVRWLCPTCHGNHHAQLNEKQLCQSFAEP